MQLVGAWVMRVSSVVILLTAMWVATAAAQPEAPPPADAAAGDKLVFVGLLPLDKPNGAATLPKLGEAQQIRAVAERALADLSHQPVIGHAQLVDQIGKGYIVKWFRCAGQLVCITDLLAPLGKAGARIAVTGDYSVNQDTYHVRLFTFSVADGKVGKQVEFDLPIADASDPQKWRTHLTPLLESKTGTVKIITNVAAPTCTIDGTPCAFEADGRTVIAPVGEHKVELAKEGYRTDTEIVTVTQGSDQEIDVALQPEKGGQGRDTKLPAVRTDKPPVIDGLMDEAVWQKAWLETKFTQHFPDEGKPPTERTELRVLYDDDSIYVGIRCFDSHPEKIIARLTRRDRDIESDKVQVDISSKNDNATAYHFQVNAAGVQVDGLKFNDSDYSADLDPLWYTATSRDALGWTAELRIPLVALRYNGDVTSFGFQVRRILQRRQEIDEWAAVPRDAKGEVSNYGTLEGLRDLKAVRLFQIVPYDSRRITFRKHQGVLDGTDTGGSFGADLKIGLTPALTLDATLNPDFGTVEVDQVVLNLSNTETFFPEKRPFFLEGADIFSTPFQLFYSRRIGRAAPLSIVGDSVEPNPQGQIWGAAKTTGILTGRLSIGVLDALTSRQDATIARMEGAAPEKVLVDPLTNFAALRLRQEFAANSSIGLLATAVNRVEPAGASTPMPGDLCPRPYGNLSPSPPASNGRCTNDAYTAGVDTVIRTDDGNWGLSAQGVGSLLENGPSRSIPDGTVVTPGSLGGGLFAEAGKYGGANWLGLVRYQGATPKLDINDAGFLQQAGIHEFQGALTWRTLKPAGPFLDMTWTLVAMTSRTWDFRGKAGTQLVLTNTLDLKNFWQISLYAAPWYDRYALSRETHSDALAEYPSGYAYQLDVKTDTRRKVILALQAFLHARIRGVEWDLNATLNVRPVPALEVDLIAEYASNDGFPRWIDTTTNADASRTFLFADLDTKTFSTTVRGTYTFSPTLSLQMYLQVFADSGHFGKVTTTTASGYRPILPVDRFTEVTAPLADNPDFRDGTINANVFLRWEFLPGSSAWLVYTRSQDQRPYDMMEGAASLRFDRFEGGPSTDVMLLKLSYLWEPLSHAHASR